MNRLVIILTDILYFIHGVFLRLYLIVNMFRKNGNGKK